MCFLFSILSFLLLCQKDVCQKGVHRCMDWYPRLWFDTIGPPSVFMPIPGWFHYCSSIEQFEIQDSDVSRSFLLLLLYWIVLIILFCFCFSIWSWVLFFGGPWRIVLGLWWGWNWICRLLFGKIAIFYSVNSTYPRAWKIFPFSGVFFYFFLQRLKVLVIHVFHLLG